MVVVNQAFVKLRHGPLCSRLVEALASGRGLGEGAGWFPS